MGIASLAFSRADGAHDETGSASLSAPAPSSAAAIVHGRRRRRRFAVSVGPRSEGACEATPATPQPDAAGQNSDDAFSASPSVESWPFTPRGEPDHPVRQPLHLK